MSECKLYLVEIFVSEYNTEEEEENSWSLLRFCSDPTGAELRDDFIFTPVDQPDCSSDPDRTSRFCSADWSWRGTGLYFMNVTLQRGDRESEPEPEPESLLSADFTQRLHLNKL